MDQKGNTIESSEIESGIAKSKNVSGLLIDFGKTSGNTVKLEFPIKFVNSKIIFNGNNHYAEIRTTVNKVNMTITFFDDNSSLYIGRNFYCGGLLAIISENNTQLSIGDDCLFSEGIHIRTGDGHSIFDTNSGALINKPKNGVIIKDHVWISRNVFLGKDSGCSENTIIGFGAVVTKYFEQSNVVIAGTPAKIIRENVNWAQESCSKYEDDHDKNCQSNIQQYLMKVDHYEQYYDDDCTDRRAICLRNKCIQEYSRTQTLPKRNYEGTYNIMIISSQAYLKYASVTIVSILENNPNIEFAFFLFSDEEYDDCSLKMLSVIENKYNTNINVIRVDMKQFKQFVINPLWPRSILIQLVPHLFLPTNIKTILYVEADTLNIGSLSELFNIDISDNIVIGSHPYYDDTYQGIVGGGIVLYNLQEMRKRDISIAQLVECNVNYNNYSAAENFLNAEYYDKAIVVDSYRYNCNTKLLSDLKINSFIIPPIMIHYCSPMGGKLEEKPWAIFFEGDRDSVKKRIINDTKSVISSILYQTWWDYASKSPFYEQILEQSKQVILNDKEDHLS